MGNSQRIGLPTKPYLVSIWVSFEARQNGTGSSLTSTALYFESCPSSPCRAYAYAFRRISSSWDVEWIIRVLLYVLSMFMGSFCWSKNSSPTAFYELSVYCVHMCTFWVKRRETRVIFTSHFLDDTIHKLLSFHFYWQLHTLRRIFFVTHQQFERSYCILKKVVVNKFFVRTPITRKRFNQFRWNFSVGLHEIRSRILCSFLPDCIKGPVGWAYY